MKGIQRILKAANAGDWEAQQITEEAVDHNATYDQITAELQRCKRLAETTRDLSAVRLLANSYIGGVGIEKSLSKAEYWFKQGIELYNDPVCMFGLCHILITVYKGYEKAETLLLKAVQLDLLDHISREELDKMVEAITFFKIRS